jgi:hypothetical protein
MLADFDVDISSGLTDSGAIMEVEIVRGSIAIGDRDSYDLRFYDRWGNLERVVTREFEHMVVPPSREERQAGPYARSWLKPPLPLADGLMLATAYWTDPADLERLRALPQEPSFEEVRSAGRASFDLFDADGRYLTSVLEQDVAIGNADEVDDEGRVYTVVTDPYPHIRRYRMVIGDG